MTGDCYYLTSCFSLSLENYDGRLAGRELGRANYATALGKLNNGVVSVDI